MYATQTAKNKLQELYNRLGRSHYGSYDTDFKFFWNKLHQMPIVIGLIQQVLLENAIPDQQLTKKLNLLKSKSNSWYDFGTPNERIAILYQTLELFTNRNAIQDSLKHFDQNYANGWTKFLERMVLPILEYAFDQLNDGGSILYLLERYKRRVEWFTKDDLMSKFKEHSGIKEDVFDYDLRLFLFDQGIDHPFSQPKTPSGKPDVVGLIDTNDPLIIEVKYYNGNAYKKNKVSDGFTQIVKYTTDYNKSIGYLVVFNITQDEIVIDSEDNTKQFPARIHFNDKDYFIIIVNLNFEVQASKQKKLAPIIITKDELINTM